METIRISVVEDISEIREGIRFVINQTPGFECVSVYENAEDAAAALPALRPDIVVMDINLPGMSGIDCIRKVRAVTSHIQFMMFTVFEEGEQVFEALSAGASGYLLKKTPPHKIIEALQELHEGGSPMSASIARKIVNSFQKTPPSEESQKLSAREKEILDHLAKGLLYKEIASKLSISTGTVRQHIHNIYEKLHVQNRTEAINKVFGR
ncbi:response regulator transcription factor [Cytophagaceae bacterium DM2B3-1]|uniref:Response regulator transcription factor n=1 Tax=Xanthocytophaga flava TaxID=3048013 RepID=A0ABT7CFF8_9BACT|nr:response regulator transcription factor [Xanthocytophaga flavus]MDJ1492464.1 response regulator transcription factor [Xanthocytophaga flavus]